MDYYDRKWVIDPYGHAVPHEYIMDGSLMSLGVSGSSHFSSGWTGNESSFNIRYKDNEPNYSEIQYDLIKNKTNEKERLNDLIAYYYHR